MSTKLSLTIKKRKKTIPQGVQNQLAKETLLNNEQFITNYRCGKGQKEEFANV